MSEDESKPAVPADLGEDGRDLWDKITAGYELDPAELRLLAESAYLTDELATLRVSLREDGPIVTGSRGQPVPHPAIKALQDGRALLRRLLAALDLPDTDEAEPSIASQNASHAANARWQQVRQLEAERRRIRGTG